MKLQVRLRDSDKLLREYFEKIPSGDQAHEARRLMLLSLQAGNGIKYEGMPRDSEKRLQEN